MGRKVFFFQNSGWIFFICQSAIIHFQNLTPLSSLVLFPVIFLPIIWLQYIRIIYPLRKDSKEVLQSFIMEAQILNLPRGSLEIELLIATVVSLCASESWPHLYVETHNCTIDFC